MRKCFLILPLLVFLLSKAENAEGQGASFSFFFPKNGEMAAPVPPVALRGLGVKFGDHIGLSTGITWYRATGMGVKGVPFEKKASIMGPIDNFMIPGQVSLILPLGFTELEFSGGVYTYFNTRLDVRTDRLEEALADHYDRKLLDGNFHHKNRWGFGWMVGASYTYYINGKIGITVGGNYLSGSSELALHGTYKNYDPQKGVRKERFEFPASELDHSGWELSIGVVMKQE